MLPSKSASCSMKTFVFTNLVELSSTKPLLELSKVPRFFEKAQFLFWLGAGPGNDLRRFCKILDSLVKRRAQLLDRASASGKSLLLYFLITIPSLTCGKHMFLFLILNIFELCCSGWPQFPPKIRMLLCCSFLDFVQRLRASILRRS